MELPTEIIWKIILLTYTNKKYNYYTIYTLIESISEMLNIDYSNIQQACNVIASITPKLQIDCGFHFVDENLINNIIIPLKPIITSLDISSTPIENIGFCCGIKNVILSGCINIKDFSPLTEAESIDISYTKITNITGMKAKNINASKCKSLSKISLLDNIETIDVSFTNINDISMLVNAKRIICVGCRNIPYIQIKTLNASEKKQILFSHSSRIYNYYE